MSDTVLAAIVSAVVALIVGGGTTLITLAVAERKLASENIIQERKAWRSTMRKLALQVQVALVEPSPATNVLAALRIEFAINLNPHDPFDTAILGLITSDLPETRASRVEEFTQRIALLLKHDWERAKWESSIWRQIRKRAPVRVRYTPTVLGDGHSYSIKRLAERRVSLFGRMRNAQERQVGLFAETELPPAAGRL